MQRQLRIGQEQGVKTNGAYGSKSQLGYRLDRGDTIKGGISLDTLDKRIGMYVYHSSSSSRRHHHSHHHHHAYRRSEYLLEEFKKVKAPTFDGEIKKLEDAEAWLLGMKKFFKLHNY